MPTSADKVLDLMDASYISAALGAAMELGLFWLLQAKALDEHAIAGLLDIPLTRCRYWLHLLCREGFIEKGPDGFESSSATRENILNVYSQDTWALLAEEAGDQLKRLCDLPVRLRKSGSTRETTVLTHPDYVVQMSEDSEQAQRFTHMLYELHQPLAEELADFLDLSGVHRLMDLGGGSGVMSLALLRRYPELTATVVDISTVCATGREIAAENSLADRITYHPADFLREELSSGFDLVLECDVNIYSEELFRRIRNSLNPDGRFVIVDKCASTGDMVPASRLNWAFTDSLESQEFVYPDTEQIKDKLAKAGFRTLTEDPLPTAPGQCRRFSEDFLVIEACK